MTSWPADRTEVLSTFHLPYNTRPWLRFLRTIYQCIELDHCGPPGPVPEIHTPVPPSYICKFGVYKYWI
jgi:hypothetical protein